MLIQEPKPLPLELNVSCYVCESKSAAYLCRYNIDDLAVQVCLCQDCIKLEPRELLKNTIGIQEHCSVSVSSYLSG